MRELSGATFDATLIEVTLPLVEGLPEQLEAGIEVADVGCGAGHAICVMAEAYPNSTFVGFDFSEEAIAMAREEAADKGLSNASFETSDAAQLDGSFQADLVTVFGEQGSTYRRALAFALRQVPWAAAELGAIPMRRASPIARSRTSGVSRIRGWMR